MAGTDASALLGKSIDSAPLTRRYWSMCGAVFLSQMFEFFDFAIIGFVVSMVAKPWHLTFGESSIILLTSGAGAIIGSFAWGWLGDRFGRRPMIVASVVTFTLGTGLSMFTPDGAWWLLAVFRVIVGIGVGGGNSVGPPIVVEFTPSRHRTVLGGLATVAFVPAGVVLTSLMAHTVGPQIGFRGLLAIGFVPALLAIWVWASVPESPRWLVSQGRVADARAVVAKMFHLSESAIPIEQAAPPRTQSAKADSYVGMYRYSRSFWATVLIWLLVDTVSIGLQLWTPTLLAETLRITTAAAAGMYVFISLGGVGGRIGFAFLSRWIGRRAAGGVQGFGAGILLLITALTHSAFLGGVSMLFVMLLLVQVVADGGWTNLVPMTAEIWPARLRARGQGLGNAFGGIGKVLGPAMLGLIAGSSNIIEPEATTDALTPAFVVCAVVMVLAGLVFVFVAPETNRRSLETVERDLESGDATKEGLSMEPGAAR